MYEAEKKQEVDISIHSLRMEGDACSGSCAGGFVISIHSLRMEGDCDRRRTTHLPFDFNPLPPYGGRLSTAFPPCICFRISIHSLRMEGDRKRRWRELPIVTFQSTPSVWRET